jgi:hypothetical protein
MASAILLNLPTRPAHDAIARQNLGSIKEMHHQHHGSALTGGAFLLGRLLDLQINLRSRKGTEYCQCMPIVNGINSTV